MFKDLDFIEISLLIILAIGFCLLGVLGYSLYAQATGITEGYVYNKTFSPAYCTTTFIMAGKVMVPMTNCYSDSYTLYIKNEDETNWFSVPEKVYDDAELEDYYSAKCDCITK